MCEIEATKSESVLNLKAVGSEAKLQVRYVTIEGKEAEEHINRAFDVLFGSLEKPW